MEIFSGLEVIYITVGKVFQRGTLVCPISITKKEFPKYCDAFHDGKDEKKE